MKIISNIIDNESKSMIFVYLFCTIIMIFKLHSALVESSISPEAQYNQFKNNCKFIIPQTIFDITHQDPLIPTSNKECLKELITSIDNYLKSITHYKTLYQNETEHSSRYTISENKLKDITKALYESTFKIKIALIKTRSLFNGFENIQPNIFDPLKCSFNDLTKCFQTEHVTLFQEIKKRSYNLLKTIKYIEKERKIETSFNMTNQPPLSNSQPISNHNKINFQPYHNSKIQKKTIFNIFLITVFLMYCSRLFIIHSNSN